eukprot:TRINITY_DN1661_c0_g3_i5.p1 TRINITY_DN1661_c0_g3~~TRINITY_DN1661_c0_g3_i5.p1  ORF type:complete len:284 (-),score=77.60 TRINITY_DN1661_c0_g3_i5:42-893(-)
MLQFWEVLKKRPEENALSLGLCPLDHFNHERVLIEEMGEEVFKVKFLSKNKEWLVHNLKTMIDRNDARGREIFQGVVDEGVRQEELRNAGPKARRNRALLPYNKGKEADDNQYEKAEVSMIEEEDHPDLNGAKGNPLNFEESKETPRRILTKWAEKAKVAIKYKELIEHMQFPKEQRCKICKQKARLEVDHLRPFFVIYNQYLKENIGMTFDEDHWKTYYLRHQKFKTLCPECMHVNNIMKAKLAQYKHKIEKSKKEYLEKLLKLPTLRILYLWKNIAKTLTQ